MPASLQPRLQEVVLNTHSTEDLPVRRVERAMLSRLRQYLAHFEPARAANHYPAPPRISQRIDGGKLANVAQQAVANEMKTHGESSKRPMRVSLHLTPPARR